MTARTWYRLDPADVWFFRDGRPFNEGDPAQMAITSLFPPHPATAVGAIRAALARGLGWSGQGPWCIGTNGKHIAETLGDGENLNGLQFRGPYLVNGTGEPLFPAPTVLVRETGDNDRIIRLTPGKHRTCDLADLAVRLPGPDGGRRDVKPLSGSWLTASGMARVLRGGVPAKEEIYRTDREDDQVAGLIFAREVRVGLARNPKTRTAEPGALYSAGFVRPSGKEGIALVVEVIVDPACELREPESPVPFGGEGHFAWIGMSAAHKIDLPTAPVSFHRRSTELLYTVTLITPALFPNRWPSPGDTLSDLPGTVVAACHDRPMMAGGWLSHGGKPGPQPLKPMLPPGTTWFLQAQQDKSCELRKRHGMHIGERTDWGYGQILIGTWQDEHH